MKEETEPMTLHERNKLFDKEFPAFKNRAFTEDTKTELKKFLHADRNAVLEMVEEITKDAGYTKEEAVGNFEDGFMHCKAKVLSHLRSLKDTQ